MRDRICDCRVWRGKPTKYVQPKLDGEYCEFVKDGQGFTYARGSDPKASLRYVKFDHTWYYQLAHALPNDTTIVGELWSPNEPASAVRSRLAADHDRVLKFSAFAMPKLRGECRRHMELSSACALMVDLLGSRSHAFPEVLWQYDYFHAQFGADLTAAARRIGVEGFVFKDGHCSDWYKWKATKTVDLVAVGFKEGRGKYEFFVGAIEGGLLPATATGRFNDMLRRGDFRIVASCSGMDDDTRHVIDEVTDLGRVFEVEYQYVGAGGRLRHPRFKRWRDDKVWYECTEDQLDA